VASGSSAAKAVAGQCSSLTPLLMIQRPRPGLLTPLPGCASTAGPSGRRLTSARCPAPDKTDHPGASRRRHSWCSGPHQDQQSKRLIDTGVSFSIFPHQSSAPASGPVLSCPSGKTTPSWRRKIL
jgi:hypothetical protein